MKWSIRLDNYSRALLMSVILTVGVITVGYVHKSPLTFFEFALIDVVSWLLFRIIYELRDIKNSLSSQRSET